MLYALYYTLSFTCMWPMYSVVHCHYALLFQLFGVCIYQLMLVGVSYTYNMFCGVFSSFQTQQQKQTLFIQKS